MFLPPIPNKVNGLPEGWVLLEYPFDPWGGERPEECALVADETGEMRLIRVCQPWQRDETGQVFFEDQPTYGLHAYDRVSEKNRSDTLRYWKKIKFEFDPKDKRFKKYAQKMYESIEEINSMFPLRKINNKEK